MNQRKAFSCATKTNLKKKQMHVKMCKKEIFKVKIWLLDMFSSCYQNKEDVK